AVKEINPHLHKLFVYAGIMDYLGSKKYALVGKHAARLVGIIYGLVDPVTKPEFFGEVEIKTGELNSKFMLTETVNDVAGIIGYNFFGNLSFKAKAVTKDAGGGIGFAYRTFTVLDVC